jgi:hypothetical protein
MVGMTPPTISVLPLDNVFPTFDFGGLSVIMPPPVAEVTPRLNAEARLRANRLWLETDALDLRCSRGDRCVVTTLGWASEADRLPTCIGVAFQPPGAALFDDVVEKVPEHCSLGSCIMCLRIDAEVRHGLGQHPAADTVAPLSDIELDPDTPSSAVLTLVSGPVQMALLSSRLVVMREVDGRVVPVVDEPHFCRALKDPCPCPQLPPQPPPALSAS